MINTLNIFLPIISIVLTSFVLIGGFFAFRSGFMKQSSEIQEQTISALKTRLDTLEKQAEGDAKELARLRQLISTIRHALKRRGLHIEIEGEYVTVIDADGQQSTKIPNIARVRPVKLTPIEDDESAKGEDA